MTGHDDCNFGYKPVKCDRCGSEFICTPSSDFYCTPRGDHCCELCLVADHDVVVVIDLRPEATA